jgi:predicted aconitase with swiveling domain
VRRPTTWTADARALIDGAAAGTALVLDEPLSFWGGLDQHTGTIVDRRHPQTGADVSKRALVMPSGRGSSSSSSVLAEAIRAGHGPALIILREPDAIVVLGALAAQLLDAATVPVLVLGGDDYERIRTGDAVRVTGGAKVEFVPG